MSANLNAQSSIDVLCALGTRPEIIKVAPVIHAIKQHARLKLQTIVSGQQADLIGSFLTSQNIVADHSLALMRAGEDYVSFMRRTIAALLPLLERLRPRSVVVQGDTSTACASAIAASALGIPVIHIEAGLRSGNPVSPYPEEALRTLITHCASLHCAPTRGNIDNLLSEGIDRGATVLSGNPIVDAVMLQAHGSAVSPGAQAILDASLGRRRVVVTLHRRENFGERLRAYLGAILTFVEKVTDSHVIFPVHPNPNVRDATADMFAKHSRITLTAPQPYEDFLALLNHADLILSDSGGIQEECATLGKPLFILRAVTERPEILGSGLARLIPDGAALSQALESIVDSGVWPSAVALESNPFGDGTSGQRIARQIEHFLTTIPLEH